MHRLDSLGLAIASVMAISHLLLPLERGAPRVHLASYSLTIGTAATLAAFLIVAVRSKGKLLSMFTDFYVVCQLALLWVFIVTLPLSDYPSYPIGFVLRYAAAFVMPYVIWRYYYFVGQREMVSTVFIGVAVCAAIVGWVELLFGKFFSPYIAMFSQDDPLGTAVRLAGSGEFRALGTMGNPIVYGVMLALTIPLGSEIRRGWLRVCYWVVVGGMALASVSTTVVAMVGVIVLGRALYARQWYVRVCVVLIIIFLLVFIMFGGGQQVSVFSNSQGTVSLSRLLMGNPDSTAIRLAIWRFVLTDIGNGDLWTMLIGHGVASVADDVSKLGYRVTSGPLNTTDNAYLNLLYENGLLGMLLYVSALLGVLVRYRHAAPKSMYWWAILSFAVGGMPFVIYAYETLGILLALNLAGLVHSESKLNPTMRDSVAEEGCCTTRVATMHQSEGWSCGDRSRISGG